MSLKNFFTTKFISILFVLFSNCLKKKYHAQKVNAVPVNNKVKALTTDWVKPKIAKPGCTKNYYFFYNVILLLANPVLWTLVGNTLLHKVEMAQLQYSRVTCLHNSIKNTMQKDQLMILQNWYCKSIPNLKHYDVIHFHLFIYFLVQFFWIQWVIFHQNTFN